MVIAMKYSNRLSVAFVILISIGMGVNCDTKAPTSPQAETNKTVRHAQDITADETWESDKTHIIAAEIFINKAIIRIQPGATVQFEKDAAIVITDSAGLIADGSERPITLGGVTAESGDWKYIYFSEKAQDENCRLINCSIQNGGRDDANNSIIYCDNAAPTITGCTISHSPSVGVNLMGDCRGIIFENNTISSCGFVPLQTYASNVSSIGNNNYVDNGLNQIRIIEGSVTSDDTWQYPSVPYRLADGLKIRNARLNINPAVELIFEEAESAIISEGGSIQAIGTPSARIIFTRSGDGTWNGIHFKSTANDINSKLINCVIENAGADDNFPANLILENASPEISNCLIHQSMGYGLYISGKVKPGSLQNNIITNNAFAPISVSAEGVSGLSPGDYLGNGMNFVEVRGAPNEDPITGDCYWDNIGMPYRIYGSVQIQSATLMLSPGLNIQMAEHSGFEVLTHGGLVADGTAELITITAAQQSPGYWNNIYFSNTANAINCQLIRCQISYGGGDLNRPGIIFCDNLSPIIRNCIFEYSQTYGVYLQGNSSVIDLPGNLFNGNGLGNYNTP